MMCFVPGLPMGLPTRWVPSKQLFDALSVILAELEAAGVPRGHITLLNSLGTHHAQSDAELREMLGSEILDGGYHLVQHDAFTPEALWTLPARDGPGDFRTGAGHSVRVNRILAEADVRIFTGLIVPHNFAGFSGGPKACPTLHDAVLPALCGFETVMENHGVANIGHPRATWGVLEGNPVWEEMREAALRLSEVQAVPGSSAAVPGRRPATFLVNVTINAARQMTGVFAGGLLEAHRQGVAFVRQHAMVPVERPYDVVITTNSGYPLDQNLYQSLKGIQAASKIVRSGGAVVCVTACQDGLPAWGGYAGFLREAGSLEGIAAMLAQPGFQRHDMWSVQTQAKVLQHCDVYVQSEGLTPQQIREALYRPVAPFSEGVQCPAFLQRLEHSYGPRVCVIPEGPECLGFLRDEHPEW
ncbi:putative PF09861 family protein [Paratrimastix pyriformis]|uniref:PF09861 family protein n=1 Tax=Paratrimastix pyriformis TaxID=342808 RepID=A0ABQ8UUU5_9EUKA|nr:putative PF09861 family protein [Paratrimastix pyriformis]